MIRRQKLKWFAFGAFASGALSLLAMLYLQPGPVIHHNRLGFLVLEEPTIGDTNKQRETAEVAEQAGAILKECGAAEFEVTAPVDGRPPSADLPLVLMNHKVIPCVVLRADREGIVIKSETRWAGE